jgi:hypothetical protein
VLDLDCGQGLDVEVGKFFLGRGEEVFVMFNIPIRVQATDRVDLIDMGCITTQYFEIIPDVMGISIGGFSTPPEGTETA